MYWKVMTEGLDGSERSDSMQPNSDGPWDGRFVAHRHLDAQGEHVDLRLECGDRLIGWRVDARGLEHGAWATEKGPHPLRWLDCDGGAERLDWGVYAWVERRGDRCAMLLRGARATRMVWIERVPGLPARAAREVDDALRDAGRPAEGAAALIRDGMTARKRAVERLCGLGRELDGRAFDDGVWRKSLAALTLEEIQAQLRTFEVRFDLRHPPEPVSRPEPLESEETGVLDRSKRAMAIARELA